ncbi:MAG TPA: translation initiation factor IF-2 [Candidatus Limiplasma sp.]|nr:translation initiation factor IF-2 [Candidatus Limiplasma sp.]
MTKAKLKDATKDLLKGAETVMESVASVRKGADELVQTLRKFENQYSREEEQRRADEKQAEQQRLVQQHTKAYTMPDSDEETNEPSVAAQPVQAAAQTEKPAAKAAPAKETAPAQEPVQAEKATPAENPATAAAKQAQPEAAAPVKAEPVEASAVKAEPADEQGAAAAKTGATISTASQQSAVKPARPAQAATPRQAAPAAQPSHREAPAAQSVAASEAQAPAQAAAQPVTQPVAPAANAAHAPAQRPLTPTAPRGPYGRPANPQAAAPQGPYGRPANPQSPFGRPAGPQGAAPMVRDAQVGAPQGNFARPAYAQGPYGRPANPQAAAPQGPYGRPANPPQGGFARPAAPHNGPYGRPANPQGGAQGPYGRPAGGAPQGARPAGGFARPAGGAARPMGGPRPAKGPELTPAVEKERVSNYDPNKKNYVRQHDPERVAKNRKQLARETFNGVDDDVVRGGRRARVKKPSAQQLMAPIRIEKAYMTAETITVKDLTERIGKPAGGILKKLLLLGIMANINSELDFDTASLVCNEFGVELEMNLAKTAEDALTETDVEDDEGDLETRPPVITIMGHVDHGKTSLLDYIRHTHVTAGEAGGITQHIGAYTVNLQGRSITFLDTPGHEAFTAMRARGTQSTDIAVLVVAADDGVMPQTVESINHAKAANVPIIVAINKMDKSGADPERVKQDLTAYNLVPEEWGGDTIMVPVSATTGEGVDNLLEMILLQADVLQLRANPNRMAKGVIIEAKLDKARGPVATVLVQNGTLHVGDNIVVGLASGRIRAMVNDKGERVEEAGPSMPVEIAGFTEVPSAGDDLMAVSDDHLGRQVVQERRDKLKEARVATTVGKVSLDNLFSQIDQGKIITLNLIVKADVQGSVEAVKQALEKLSNDSVKVRILHSGVGAITKDDVNLANAFEAIIIGFNIRPDNNARDMAEKEGVDIRLYRIIYQAIEDVQKAMKGLLAPEFKEVLLGHAEVRSVFRITGAGIVAGCYVTDGKLQRNAQVRLLRDNVVMFEGKLSSLKRFKDDAKEVATGYECGASLEGFNDIKEGDTVECFMMEEIER